MNFYFPSSSYIIDNWDKQITWCNQVYFYNYVARLVKTIITARGDVILGTVKVSLWDANSLEKICLHFRAQKDYQSGFTPFCCSATSIHIFIAIGVSYIRPLITGCTAIYVCIAVYVIPRVHNNRREGEYPTSVVWPNALRKVMTYNDLSTLKVSNALTCDMKASEYNSAYRYRYKRR